MNNPHQTTPHRGFSIIELIAVILVLAIMVPTTLSMVADASRTRLSTARATTAATFAASIAEHIIADTHSNDPTIAFPALADSDTYLNAPDTGLNHRLAWLIEHHANLGYTHTITIGPLISADTTITNDPALDIYRRITVAITWSHPTDGPQSFDLPLIVGDPGA